MEMKTVIPTVIAVGAAAAAGGDYLAHQGGSSHNGVKPVVFSSANTAAAAADCAETPLALSQYDPTNGANIMAPLSAKLVNGQYEFNSGDADTTAEEVAKEIGSNTAALAIVYTIIDASKTGIVPADVVSQAAETLDTIQSSTAQRNEICNIVVSGILGAPEQFNYQSSTGSILTFDPVYDSAKDFAGIDGQVTANAAPTEVFNIAPVAGSQNVALQTSIAASWGITPRGAIIETTAQEKKVQPSKSGQPVKTTTHGNVPSANTAPQTNGGTTASAIVKQTGGSTGGGGGAGPHRQNLPGRSPHGPGPTGAPEGRPNAKHNTPSGGATGGNTGGGNTGGNTTTTPGITITVTTPNTTPTGTTPTGTTETTPTTTTSTTPTTTTTTTTTTTPPPPVKAPAPPTQY